MGNEFREIVRYKNGKLYDTESKRYTNLSEIAIMLQNGEQIIVTDRDTQKDRTRQTLLEVMHNQILKGQLFVSTDEILKLLSV